MCFYDFKNIQLNSEINKGSVSVASDGVKTWSQLLNSLFALIDGSKVNDNSVLEYDAVGISKTFYRSIGVAESPKTYTFSRCGGSAINSSITEINIKSSGSTNYSVIATVGGSITYGDVSNQPVNGGRVIRLVY